ncbi:MAG: efflux RND transporter periplasmic adaptor subunit [Gammaproteobacteria bacterium]|nr:efflux RND transporter periplasmic adaptor subunit [Gammaproteobacteria bacterium]MBQ0838631.1 efflux RND transporter periplasmic adaptor subunit [Gammaproteobacteria bacterium]
MPASSVFKLCYCKNIVGLANFPRLLFSALVALLSLTACEKTAGPAPARGPVEVAVVAIQAADVPLTTELPGRTSAYRIAEVRPQVGGIIAQRLFVEGSEVTAGEPLYQIASELFIAEVNRAAAAVLRSEATLSAALLKTNRYEDLIGKKMISQENYDDAHAALRAARANVAVAKAEREIATINLQYSQIKAPISGRIGSSFVTDGALVEAEQEEVLAVIRQLDPLYVDISQTSKDLLTMKRQLASGQIEQSDIGATVIRLLLEDGSEYSHPGSLQFSEVSVDKSTGSVTLRATVPNPDALLLPGMFVRARLEQGVQKAALLAPQRAITFEYSGSAVAMVVGADNKVERRLVKTGRAIGDHWLILQGLQVGERVIIDGLQKVRPGVEVSTVAYTAAAKKDVD